MKNKIQRGARGQGVPLFIKILEIKERGGKFKIPLQSLEKT